MVSGQFNVSPAVLSAKEPLICDEWKAGGPYSQSEISGEEINLSPESQIKLRFFRRPACRLVTIPTELYRLNPQ
jgi:hypothetical protein